VRRASISSILSGFQRFAALRKVTPEAALLIPGPREKECHTMPASTKNRLTSAVAAVAAGVVLFGLLSPATASHQNSPAVLTSHSPWLAPTGHRQPTRADVPQNEFLSAWEREQQLLDAELDRKLIICRGC
jgi:hypothetical protein